MIQVHSKPFQYVRPGSCYFWIDEIFYPKGVMVTVTSSDGIMTSPHPTVRPDTPSKRGWCDHLNEFEASTEELFYKPSRYD